MALAIRNKYEIAPADEAVEATLESLMECTDEQRLSLDHMSFGNMTNDSIPTMGIDSRTTVKGCLFGPAEYEEEPMYLSNDEGATPIDIENAPNDTNYYLCAHVLESAEGKSAIFVLKACTTVAYDPAWCGIYEQNKDIRVFGMCRKEGGAFPAKYKWLYPNSGNLSSLMKVYAAGLDITASKVKSLNPGEVKTIIIHNGDVIDIDYPCSAFLRMYTHVHVHVPSSTGGSISTFSVSAYISLKMLIGTQQFQCQNIPQFGVVNSVTRIDSGEDSNRSSVVGTSGMYSILPGRYGVGTICNNIEPNQFSHISISAVIDQCELVICNVSGCTTGEISG